MRAGSLQILQFGLRDRKELESMKETLIKGGDFTKAKKKMEIVRFEDGIYAVHDGHHRAIAIHRYRVGGIILPDEYVLVDRTYAEYKAVNLPLWYTPFDPRSSLRRADFFTFKNEVKAIHLCSGVKAAEDYIKDNKAQYSVPRGFFQTVDEMSDSPWLFLDDLKIKPGTIECLLSISTFPK